MHVLLAAGECKEELAASSIAMFYVLCKYDTAATFWPLLLYEYCNPAAHGPSMR